VLAPHTMIINASSHPAPAVLFLVRLTYAAAFAYDLQPSITPFREAYFT
ncbi:42951_t:CDS:1, partial [Gigaspora margarita]